MKRIIILIFIIFIIGCKKECKITLNPIQDTVIEEWQKDKIWGDGESISIRCCGKKNWHSLLKFDLSELKNIKSSTLSLYKRKQEEKWINYSVKEVKIYKILNNWNENISWNEFYNNNKIGEEIGIGHLDVNEGWYNINIKTYDNLLIKTFEDYNLARFHSKEDINKPKLIINYCE